MNLKYIRPHFHEYDTSCGATDQYKEQTEVNEPSDREFCLPKETQESKSKVSPLQARLWPRGWVEV